jgi:hypothetical protein
MNPLLFRFLICASLINSFQSLKSQPLVPGSIAFIGWQSDASQAIAFVTLVPMNPGTQISITDNKWGYNHLVLSEQTVIWTSPDTALPVGTIVKLRDNGSANMTIIGPGTVTGRVYICLGQGDQLLAYTGSQSSPSFIAGISNSNWQTNCDSLTFFQFRTCLPAPLINGYTAIAFTAEQAYNVDNGFFNISPFNATGLDMLGIINNVNYWFLDNASPAAYPNWPDWRSGSTTNIPFASVIQFEQPATATISEGGSLAELKLVLSGPQTTPQSVVIQAINFPGITASDYSTTPPITGNSIQLDIPANALEATINVQALLDGFGELNENVTFKIASVSGGLTIGTRDNFQVTIVSTDQNFPQIEFSADTVWITEGQSSSPITININPISPSSYFVILAAQNGPGIQSDYFVNSPNSISNGEIFLQSQSNVPTFSFSVTPFNDQVIEADEFVRFTITTVTNGLQIGTTSTLVLGIRDNDNIPVFRIPELLLNEINSNNTDFADNAGEYDDWVELYNADSVTINFSGYHITNAINNPTRFTFPSISAQTTMAPGAFKILWADQNTTQGPLHLNFNLNTGGGLVALFAPDGETLIDAINYPAMVEGQTYGRLRDGAENWKMLYFATPGGPNSDSIPVPSLQPGIQSPDNEFSAWPNPAKERITLVKSGKPFIGHVDLQLTDMQGKTVPTYYSTISSGKAWTIELHELPAGIYIANIQSREGVSRMKLIKSN